MHIAGLGYFNDYTREDVSELTVRDATAKDVLAWYGEAQKPSMRAFVAELDGELVGLCGVYRDGDHVTAVAGLKPALRERKRDIVILARRARELFSKYPIVLALASDTEPTAPAFLRYAGFVYVGPTPVGEIYLWKT